MTKIGPPSMNLHMKQVIIDAFFKPQFRNLVINEENAIWESKQNCSTICQKLRQLGRKKHRDMNCEYHQRIKDIVNLT